MDKKYLCDMPRVMATVDAVDEEAALAEIRRILNEAAAKHVAMEDITNKEFPSGQEAMKAKDKTLLGEVAKVLHIGKNLSAMKRDGFYGVGDTDIVVGKSLLEAFGENVEGLDDLVSCKSYFGDGTVGKPLFSKTVEGTSEDAE